ncbi:MAG: hypothetical protein ABIP94_07160 [Planctomycetota bacterium]
MDTDKTGAGLGLPVVVALVGALLERNTRGGTIVVGPLNLGGSIEMLWRSQGLVGSGSWSRRALARCCAGAQEHRVPVVIQEAGLATGEAAGYQLAIDGYTYPGQRWSVRDRRDRRDEQAPIVAERVEAAVE